METLEPMILRWVWSTYSGTPAAPACAQYCRRWRAPVWSPGGSALVLCEFRPGDLAKARADPTLTVLDSLHMGTPMPATVLSALTAAHPALAAALKTSPATSAAAVLHHMAKTMHPVFAPPH